MRPVAKAWKLKICGIYLADVDSHSILGWPWRTYWRSSSSSGLPTISSLAPGMAMALYANISSAIFPTKRAVILSFGGIDAVGRYRVCCLNRSVDSANLALSWGLANRKSARFRPAKWLRRGLFAIERVALLLRALCPACSPRPFQTGWSSHRRVEERFFDFPAM